MGSSWQGGDNFIQVRRGSANGRAGGTHSGPSGKRATRFYQSNQNPVEQARRDKATNEARSKAGTPRPTRVIPSGFRDGG